MEDQIPHEKKQFWGDGTAQCNVLGKYGIDRAKMAEPIELPFGMVW